MLGDVVGEAFSGIFRFIFRILVEVLFEFLIKGFGYLICRPFNKRVDPDGLIVTVIGILAWGMIVFGSYQFMAFLEVDSCLDSGGSYNYQLCECERGD